MLGSATLLAFSVEIPLLDTWTQAGIWAVGLLKVLLVYSLAPLPSPSNIAHSKLHKVSQVLLPAWPTGTTPVPQGIGFPYAAAWNTSLFSYLLQPKNSLWSGLT